jgi:curved DNA-binding protein
VKTAHPDRPGGDVERLRQVIEAHKLLKSMASAPLNFTLVRRTVQAKPLPPRIVGLQITVREALFGGERRVDLGQGRRFDIMLAPGMRPGDTVQLARTGDGTDILARISVAPERGLTIRGNDLWQVVEIHSLLGRAPMTVETPRGRRAFFAPEVVQDGGVVRFKGQGMPAKGQHRGGDLILSLNLRQSLGRTLFRRFSGHRAA